MDLRIVLRDNTRFWKKTVNLPFNRFRLMNLSIFISYFYLINTYGDLITMSDPKATKYRRIFLHSFTFRLPSSPNFFFFFTK